MTGQPCPKCGGHYTVYATRPTSDGLLAVRYFSCWCCGYRPTPNKVIGPPPPARKRRSISGTDKPQDVSTN